MHNAALSARGLNAVYLAFNTRDTEGAIHGMKALNIRGLSVTLPHKTDVIPLLDKVDDLARRIGAVNTVVNDDGLLTGYNTDAIGALRALEDKVALPGKRCTIVGAGGAARAVGFILKESGVQVAVANRSPGRGKALARSLFCPFIPLEELGKSTPDILINTTPVGMAPNSDRCIIPEQILQKGMAVMDIIYNPLETKLLGIAASKGCITIDGLGMFIRQGAEQFRLWTGLEPPIDVMTSAVKKALGI